MLTTKIKASTITNLTDARYFAAWGVDWLGFDLDSSSDRFIGTQQIQAIKAWLDGIQIAGEFNLHNASEIAGAIELLELDILQAGHMTTADTLLDLRADIPVIKEWVVGSMETVDGIKAGLDPFSSIASFFILDFDRNGYNWNDLVSGKMAIRPEDLQAICRSYPVLLGLNVPANQLIEMFDLIAPEGLNILGGEEEKTGFKSFDDLDELFELLTMEM